LPGLKATSFDRAMLVEHRSTAYAPSTERAWHLSVWMAPDVHAWCVHDRATGHLMALYAAKGDRLPNETELPLRPASVSFVALPGISTLVPESALAPGTEVEHLRLVHGAIPTGLLRDEPIGTLGARCVYLHDEQAEHRLMSRFPNARPLPLQGVIVQAAIARSGTSTVAVLDRSDKRMDLAIARGKRLLLSNTFPAIRAEDVLYYLLFALEQCGVPPSEVHLALGGTHLTDAEEDLLRRYVSAHLAAITPSAVGLAEDAVPGLHRWTALIEQFACAS
jgi:hypothetical protein